MALMTLVLGCLVWFPIMVWVVSLIHWMVGGDIDAISGVIGIFIALALGYMTFVPPVPGMSPYTFSAVVLTVILFPFARSGMTRRELAQIEVDGVDEAYQLLGQRPNNPLAKMKLARHLFALGFSGWAIAVAETVLPQLPEKVFLDEHRMVRNWKRMPHAASAYRTLPCIECSTPNPPGRTHCIRCGEPFLMQVVRGKFMPSRTGKRLVSVWICLVLVLAGMPAATSLPGPIAAIVILVLMMVGAGTLFVGFRTLAGDNS